MTDIVLFIIGCCVLVLLCGERERQKGAVFGHQLVRLTGHLSAANTVDSTIRAIEHWLMGLVHTPTPGQMGLVGMVFVFKGKMGLTIEIWVSDGWLGGRYFCWFLPLKMEV